MPAVEEKYIPFYHRIHIFSNLPPSCMWKPTGHTPRKTYSIQSRMSFTALANVFTTSIWIQIEITSYKLSNNLKLTKIDSNYNALMRNSMWFINFRKVARETQFSITLPQPCRSHNGSWPISKAILTVTTIISPKIF